MFFFFFLEYCKIYFDPVFDIFKYATDFGTVFAVTWFDKKQFIKNDLLFTVYFLVWLEILNFMIKL